MPDAMTLSVPNKHPGRQSSRCFADCVKMTCLNCGRFSSVELGGLVDRRAQCSLYERAADAVLYRGNGIVGLVGQTRLAGCGLELGLTTDICTC